MFSLHNHGLLLHAQLTSTSTFPLTAFIIVTLQRHNNHTFYLPHTLIFCFQKINSHLKTIVWLDGSSVNCESMLVNAAHSFLRDLHTYYPHFNNCFPRIACQTNNYKAYSRASANIIHFLVHIKPAFGKHLSEHVLDAGMVRQCLAMFATRGHKYCHLYHQCSTTILCS